MKATSAKQKGTRYENYLVERLRTSVDSNTSRNYGSGAGLDKGDLRVPSHNLVIEAKNHAKINLISWWEQTEEQGMSGDKVALAIRHPKFKEFDKNLVVIDLEYFIELLNGSKEEIQVEMTMDYQKQRTLNQLKSAISAVNREWQI